MASRYYALCSDVDTKVRNLTGIVSAPVPLTTASTASLCGKSSLRRFSTWPCRFRARWRPHTPILSHSQTGICFARMLRRQNSAAWRELPPKKVVVVLLEALLPLASAWGRERTFVGVGANVGFGSKADIRVRSRQWPLWVEGGHFFASRACARNPADMVKHSLSRQHT